MDVVSSMFKSKLIFSLPKNTVNTSVSIIGNLHSGRKILKIQKKKGCFLVCFNVSVCETFRRVEKFPRLSCDISEAGSCRSGVVQSRGTGPCTKDPVICIVSEGSAQQRGNTSPAAQRQSRIEHREQVNFVRWGKQGMETPV